MAGFLRFLILLGMLAIAVAAACAFYTLPALVMPSLVQVAEKNNAGFVEVYTNTIWKKYRAAIVPLISANPPQLQGHPEVAQFAQDTAQYFQALPLLRINLYTPNGALLLTINGTSKLTSGETIPNTTVHASNNTFSTAFSQGKRAALVQTLVHILAPNAATLPQGNHAALVQTLVPILAPNTTTPEGMVEIINNLPDTLQVLAPYEFYVIGGPAAVSGGILLLVFLGLFIVVRRLEAIITKQHEANTELMNAVAAAEAASRDKSQFLANVSHELRTPLNAIIGFSNMLKQEVLDYFPDKKYENYLNDIHTAGTHLLSLINDILDYSKAEAGKLELEASEINATKLVQNSLRLVSPRAESGNVMLKEMLPKEQFTMVTDGKKFKQIMLNLLSNAVKFTPAGGEVRVTAWYNASDDTLTFEVCDTGIGIAPKDISRAMSPFGQVDNSLKRKFEGTGLGLPLTKRFVELMGGKFTIESEVNKGTRITFTLPRTLKERDGVVVVKHVA